MEQQINDSIRLIIGSIEHQARAEKERYIALNDKLFAEKTAAIESEIKNKYDGVVAYELEKQRIAANKKASELESENKAALAALRASVTDEVFADVEEQIRRFAESPDYEGFLAASVRKMSALYEGEAVILLRTCDGRFEKTLADAFGRSVSFEYDDSVRFGGVKVRFPKAAVLADDTLDARLAASKKDFIKTSGLGFKGCAE